MSDEYKSFLSKVQDVKDEVKKKTLKKPDPKQALSEEQVRWAEKTIGLTNSAPFKVYTELEALVTANSLRHAFLQRNGVGIDGKPEKNTKTYGEQMSYNEGYYHGLLALKSERERIWMTYLKFQRDKKET